MSNHENNLLFTIETKEDIQRHLIYIILYSIFIILMIIPLARSCSKKDFNFNLFCFINKIEPDIMYDKLNKSEIMLNNIIEELYTDN